MPSDILPPSLNVNDKIGVFAPSSRIDKDRLEAGVALLKQRGYEVYVHPQTFKALGQSAGSSEEKAAAFHDLLKDKSIKAIVTAGGGNRCVHMLDHVDWGLVRANPKYLIGFSDITAILNASLAKASVPGFFGFTANWLERMEVAQVEQSLRALSGETVEYPLDQVKILHPGKAQAAVFGGTMVVLQCLLGTDYMPDPRGKILCFEDDYEETSRIDRVLWHLRRSIPFDQLAGIIFGHFTRCQDTGSKPFGFELGDIIKEHSRGLNIPIVMNAPFGHGENLYAMPIGKEVTFEVSNKATLRF